MKRTHKIFLAVILVLGLLLYGFSLLTRPGVLVVSASQGMAVDAVTGNAKVFANADVNVKSERFGRVAEMRAEIGKFVKKGDVLAVQTTPELEIKLASTRRRLETARKRLEVENPLRFEVQDAEKAVAASELAVSLQQEPVQRLEAQRRELEKRRSRLTLETLNVQDSAASLEEQLKLLELEQKQMSTVAPFDGEIVEVFVFAGDQIWGSTNLCRLVAHGRFVEVTLNEEDFYGVAPGQAVTLRLASYPDREFSGQVSSLSSVADSGSKSRKVFVAISATDKELVPGLTGEAMILKGKKPNAVIIPRRALMGDRVYVVEGGRVEIRRVKPGFLALNVAEIAEGLMPGELVVLEGQPGLSQGQRVRTEEVAE